MMQTHKPEWKQINDEGDFEITKRLKVFGGWLVLTKINTSKGGYGAYTETQDALTQSFVADPKHEWEIKGVYDE